jgi:hypothetical protein
VGAVLYRGYYAGDIFSQYILYNSLLISFDFLIISHLIGEKAQYLILVLEKENNGLIQLHFCRNPYLAFPLRYPKCKGKMKSNQRIEHNGQDLSEHSDWTIFPYASFSNTRF